MSYRVPLHFILLLGLISGTAAPVAAQAPKELVEWRTNVTNRWTAAVALSRFYVTIYNTGQIETREVEVQQGDTPTDIMRREGVWPQFLGPSTRLLDAVVCDLNPGACRRKKIGGTEESLASLSRNVSDTEPTDGNWSSMRPGTMLRIPDYTLKRRYETIVTTESYLDKTYSRNTRILPSGDLAALYCNHQPMACPGKPPLTWDDEGLPPILQFDPKGYQNRAEDSSLPKDVIATFLDNNDRTTLIAVPYLTLGQNIALSRTGDLTQIGLDDIQKSLPANILVTPQLRTESSLVLQEKNRASLDRMMFILPEADEGQEGRIVTIYHFDKQAKLKHCAFQNLTGVKLFEWQTVSGGGSAGPEEVNADTTEQDCTFVKGVAVDSYDHGTHTLGLLVSQLETFARALPPDVTYFKVVHVPLDASQFENGTASEAKAKIASVLSDMALANPKPDVVAMSLSWPAGDMEILDEKIRQKEDLTTFVVAAPRDEAQNECARGPAGIKRQDGAFVRNVISVVGLDLVGDSDSPNIVLLDRAGTGSRCHEIGALGNLWGPVGDGRGIDLMAGASQATPIVAATVAELIRRRSQNLDTPNRISQQLVSTAWFNPDMINDAKATLLDFSGVLRVGTDLIVTRSGCQVFGTYVQIRNIQNEGTDFIYHPGNQRNIASKRDLLSWRNLPDGRVLVVRLVGDDVVVDIGEREANMDKRNIQFSPERLIVGQNGCDGISVGNDNVPISVVDQLIISKLGD